MYGPDKAMTACPTDNMESCRHHGPDSSVADQSIIQVTPTAEELDTDVQKNIVCPEEGCGAIMPHSSALRFHMIKTHRIEVIILICNTFFELQLCFHIQIA